LKKLVITGLAVLTAIALSAVAFAQSAAPIIEGTLKITPANAGTKANPANGRLVNVFNVNAESNSTLKRIEYTIPTNVKLNGAGFPTCTVDQINNSGDDVCKAKSKVGTGAATALLGPNKTQLNFEVEVYVAGPKALSLYLQTSLFNIAIPAEIVGQKVQFDIPERVQQPVNGLYSYVTSVTADLGKQDGISASIKKKKTIRVNGQKRTKIVTVPYVQVVGCTGGLHNGSVKAFLANNPDPPQVPSISDDASSPCTK
jgi:hypothetical protein